MPEANQCPQCGTPLKNPLLDGLCPACLLKEGAAGDTVTGRRFPHFEPPSVTELAAKFPQLDILELIGKGGMGAVYKARQKELDRLVALKILPPGIGDEAGFAERFSREAKALAKLNHPGIVTIHDFGRADGLYYFVMEFVDGVNLRQLLQGSRISPREALAIVPQICDALQFAHDHGIVHRDIKPENILMDRRGRVKVADFGLAKLVGVDSTASFGVPPSGGSSAANPDRLKAELRTSELTEAGKVMGTPNYMAPEQKEHPNEVDHRADIYALGVVFYQMLTGELPGKRIEAPSKKVHIDVRLDEIVLRALESKPELRYQQASQFKTQVETIATESEKSEAGGQKPEGLFSRIEPFCTLLSETSLGKIINFGWWILVGAIVLLFIYGRDSKGSEAREILNVCFFFLMTLGLVDTLFRIRKKRKSGTQMPQPKGNWLKREIVSQKTAPRRIERRFWKRFGWTFPFAILVVLGAVKYFETQRTKVWHPQKMQWMANANSIAAVLRVTDVAQEDRIVIFKILYEPGLSPKEFAISFQGPSLDKPFSVPDNLKSAAGILAPTIYGHNARPGHILSGTNVAQGSGLFEFAFVMPDAEKAAMVTKQARDLYLGKPLRIQSGNSIMLFSLIRQTGKDAKGKMNFETLNGMLHLDSASSQKIQVPTILMDDGEVVSVGEWGIGTTASNKFGKTYLSCPAASAMPQASATCRPHIKVPGKYDVEIWYPQGTNRSAHAWWIISCADGESRVLVDQTINGGQWIKIAGDQSFAAGTNGFVRLVNKTPGFFFLSGNNVVVADAVRLVPANPAKKSLASENFTAEYIVAMSLEKYKSLSSFRAEAVVLTEMRYDDDPKLHLITGQSSIEMARPHYLRFVWGDSNSTNSIKDVIWSNDEGAFESAFFGVKKVDNHKETQIENVQYSLDWKNPKPLVSELFFDIRYNWMSRLTKLSLEPEARIDDDDCFVISGEGKKLVAWIRKKDFLVKQRREESEGKVVAAPPASANPLFPTGLRMIPTRTLKLYPQTLPSAIVPPSIPSPATAPPGLIAPQSSPPDTTPSRTFSIRRTQTFRQIAVNEPLRKEDYSHASIPLLSNRNDPKARRNLAQALVLSGKNEQALEEFMWCWDHGKETKDFHSTRVVYVLADISSLGMKYPPAFDALRKRRDDIENKLLDGKGGDEISDLSYLNSHLKDSGRTLALFDRLPTNSPVRKEMFGHLLGQLIEAKRYEDILALLDPEKALDGGMEARRRDMEFRKRYSMGASPADEYLRKRALEGWSQYFEVLAGAKKTDRAKKMADTILEFDSASDTQALLEKAASHAGNQNLVDYLQSKNAASSRSSPKETLQK
ncbi:MAG: protein kinase [Verrucomicrobiota bacterium]